MALPDDRYFSASSRENGGLPPGAVTVNRRCEETAHMRYYVSLAAVAASLIAALFGSDVSGFWP
jgi:hypothetical protein